MIDFIIGSLIGLVGAIALAVAAWVRASNGDLWYLLGGSACGYAGGIVLTAIAFLVCLGFAFRPS